MKDLHPYASDLARFRLLYKLPLPAAEGRRLVIGRPGQVQSVGWDSDAREVSGISDLANSTAPDDETAASYQSIALPAVLSPLDGQIAGIGITAFLGQVARLLAPGGVLVGHIDHGMYLGTLLKPKNWGGLVLAWRDRQRPCNADRVLQMLEQAGLQEVSCYYVQPSITSPMGLVPSAAAVASPYFVRGIRAARSGHSAPAYWGRRLIAEAGLGKTLRDTLFFWARRPC